VHVTDINEAPLAVFTPSGGSPTDGKTGIVNISAWASSVGTIVGNRASDHAVTFGGPSLSFPGALRSSPAIAKNFAQVSCQHSLSRHDECHFTYR
jgi:hypothetical protein